MITIVRNYYRESHVLRLKHWDIDQATPNAKLIFGQHLQKSSKIENVNIYIKVCIFKLVYF